MDEKVFRFVELTCYWSLILGFPILRAVSNKHSSYFMPGTFCLFGSVGVVFLTRYFIYERPQYIFDRTPAQKIVLTRQTKRALFVGYAMSIPMFFLGVLGVYSPVLMERVITAISPMRFLL
ncbi:MAG: hypothetical protein V4773_08840 [Verrucomicrobiota bacterium]